MRSILYSIVLWLSIASALGQQENTPSLDWLKKLPDLIDTLPTPEKNLNRFTQSLDSLREKTNRLTQRVDSVRQLINASPVGEVLPSVPGLPVPSLPRLKPELPQISPKVLLEQLQNKVGHLLTQLPEAKRWANLPSRAKDLSLEKAGAMGLEQLAAPATTQFQQAQQTLSAAKPTYGMQDLQKLQRLQQARQQLLGNIDAEQPAKQALEVAQGQLDKAKQQYQRIGSLQDSSSFQQTEEELSFKDRWYVGGMFHASRTQPLQLTVNPIVGYKLLPNLLIGGSTGMQITLDNTSKFTVTHQWQPDYRLFSELYKGSWFVHVQYKNRWKKIGSSEVMSNPSTWMVGAGRTYQANKLKGRFMMLYNVETAQVTAVLDCQVSKGHVLVFFNPHADVLKQQQTWAIKWGIDLW